VSRETCVELGELAEDGRLPTEADLARIVGISRGSIREAVAELEEQELVSRRQGSGTFQLRDPATLCDDRNLDSGVTDLIEGAGWTPGTRWVSLERRQATPEEARRLRRGPHFFGHPSLSYVLASTLRLLLAWSATLYARVGADDHGMTGAAQFALMKPTAHLVYASRAALVQKDALHEALRHGTMAGAALDDFHREPLPQSSSPLDCPNVLVTPHIEGSTIESIPRPSASTVASILTPVRGERPRLVFSPQVDEPVAGGRWGTPIVTLKDVPDFAIAGGYEVGGFSARISRLGTTSTQTPHFGGARTCRAAPR